MERSRSRGPGDRGDIVLGWLTRVAVVLALLGLVGFDLVSLGSGRFQAEDRAQAAAREAVRSFTQSNDVQRAYETALSQLAEDGGAGSSIAPESFSVAPDGAVTLTLVHTSPTLLVEKIAPIRSWATSSTTVTGRPAT